MADFTNEEWRPIPGYETSYEISDLGRARSVDRVVTPSRGVPYKLPGKMLKQQLDSHGYFTISLSGGGSVKRGYIHQLVLTAFDRPRGPLDEGRHLNGIPTDNRLCNLAWGTKSQNIADAKRHGTFPVLERRPGAKLNRESVVEIFTSNAKTSDLAARYGVGYGVIRQIKLRQTWASVTEGLVAGDYERRGTWFGTISDADIFDTSTTRANVAERLGVSESKLKSMRRIRRKQIARGE